jgi:hypothetical protein
LLATGSLNRLRSLKAVQSVEGARLGLRSSAPAPSASAFSGSPWPHSIVFAHRGAQRIQQALIYDTTGLPGGRLLRFLTTLITTAAGLGLLYVLAV